jgi:hypothetical protein
MNRSKRHTYWIDIRSQGPFLLKVGSVWAGGILLLSLLLYYLADEELGRSFYSVHLRLRNTWQVLLPAVIVAGGISFLVTIGATLLLAVRESHRLGGPIHKFRLLFLELGAGVLDTGFRLRKGDILFDLAESYRDSLRAHADRILLVQRLGDRAERALSEARLSLGGHGLPAEEMHLVDAAADAVAQLRDALKDFRVGPA